jgi:dienelactone hydrolase
MLWVLILALFSGFVLSQPSVAQTPAGLLTLGPEEPPLPAERDWERLGVSNYELRILERFYRDETGVEGFHIAFESGELNMTGVLVQPHIELLDPDAPPTMVINPETGKEEEEEIKYPLIVLSHGSPYGVSPAYREIAIELAHQGYVVMSPTFRGRAGREGKSQGLVELSKGEVIDLLQLTQIARQIEYVDARRMGVVGFGDGATTVLPTIERSNVFQVAIVVSPAPFGGLAEFGYAGYGVLERRSQELFGRELSRNELLRELYARDAFQNVDRITTPLLMIITGADPSHKDQLYFVTNLQHYGIGYRLLEYPSMSPDFLTAIDDGTHSQSWHEVRDAAWGQIFALLDEHLQLPEEDEGLEVE